MLKNVLTIFSIPQKMETVQLVMVTVDKQHLVVDACVTIPVTTGKIVATTRLMFVGSTNLLPDPVLVSFLVILIYYNCPVADPRGRNSRDENPHGPISFIIMQPPAKNIDKQGSNSVGCVQPNFRPYVFWWPPLDICTGRGVS